MSIKTKKIIIYSTLLIIAVSLLIWWNFFNVIRARDYQRLGDMRVLESEMNSYYIKYNTYIVPECLGGSLINFCTGNSDRPLNVSTIVDPINLNSLRYVVGQMHDDNFKVEFNLEGGVGGLPSGIYTLTREGLGR